MFKITAVIATLLVAAIAADESKATTMLSDVKSDRILRGKAAKNSKNRKVRICHYSPEYELECPLSNIRVRRFAARRHIAHGDFRGSCEDFCELSGSTYDSWTCRCVGGDEESMSYGLF